MRLFGIECRPRMQLFSIVPCFVMETPRIEIVTDMTFVVLGAPHFVDVLPLPGTFLTTKKSFTRTKFFFFLMVVAAHVNCVRAQAKVTST